jgi:exodeoxyribonuclease III
MDWFDRLLDHAAGLLHDDVPDVLAGDYNVVPIDFDVYSVKSFVDNALVQPAPRAAYAQLVDIGWTDALRELHPDQPMFTFWSYLRNRWPREAGLQLDHLLLSPAIAAGEPNASDHAPAWIELAPAAKQRRSKPRRRQ